MNCHSHLPPVDYQQISAVSILAGEHEVILQTLSCLEIMANGTVQSHKIPQEHALQALEVLRKFADRCHHGKEEDVLFPAMEARYPGFGPTAVMRQEHVEGRAYILGMAKAVEENLPEEYAHNAHAYVELLRQHIAKENEILFPIAQDFLSKEEDDHILDVYRTIEHEDLGTGVHEHLLGLANGLAINYGVPIASENPIIMKLLTAVCGCKKEPNNNTSDNGFKNMSALASKVSQAHGLKHPTMQRVEQVVVTLANISKHDLPRAVKDYSDELTKLTDNFEPWLGSCNTVDTLFKQLQHEINNYSLKVERV